MDGSDSEDMNTGISDMTVFVQNLLQHTQYRFEQMSEFIVSKIDEMGSRIDDLEHNFKCLRANMGMEGSSSSLPPSKSDSEVKPTDGLA